MRSIRFPLLLLSVAIISACSHTPENTLPPLPVNVAATSAVQVQADWQSFYQDPELNKLIIMALDHNRDLRQAALQSAAFRAQYQIRQSDRLPDVAVQAEFSRQRTPITVGSNNSISQQSALELGLVAYELDLFDRIKNLEQAALNEYLASMADERTVKLALISDVATSWLSLLSYQQQSNLLSETLANYRENLNLQLSLAAEGITSSVAVQQARLLVNQPRLNLSSTNDY